MFSGAELVKRIDDLLISKKIPKKKFYNDLKLPNNACTKWCAGSIPSCLIIQEIAHYFNVSMDYLMGDKVELSPELSQLIADYQSLDVKYQNLIKTNIELLK